MGTALTDSHIVLLSRYAKNIVLIFDNDNGGLGALGSFNERKLEEKRKSTNFFRVSFNEYKESKIKDADEFLNKIGKDKFVDFVKFSIENKELQKRLKGVKSPKKVAK
jgi:DNA primase